MNKASIPNFSFQFSVEVTQINVPGWGGVGGLTMIILPVSVQVELHWNLPTRTELGKNRCSDWGMQERFFNFVRFSKTGSDTTSEPNFDEKTDSDLRY